MKLSPKKGKAAAKEAPAPEKKAKRKASRGGGDTVAKAKDFLINHVEKVVLGSMSLLALMLIYSGFSKEKINTSPAAVDAVIQQAKDTMTRPTWSEVKATRIPEPDKFDQTATLDTKQVSLNDYAWNQPLHPRLMERGKQRPDPELLAPIDLHVVSDYGPVAMRPADAQTGSNLFGGTEDPTIYPIPEKTASKMTASRGGGSRYESRYLVSITGLIPYKQQFDAYQQAFKDAAEYSPDRDVPKYLVMIVERREVAADGTVGEWKELDTIEAFKEEARWNSVEEEIADPEYLLTESKGLTMSLPPMAMRDISRWAVHPSIPKVQRMVGAGAGVENRGVENRGGTDATGNAAGERSIWDLGSARSDGGSRTNYEKSGVGDNVGSDQELAQLAIPHPNAMFRFIDFSVTPGKQYQYRTRAVLEDPNAPREDTMPSDSSCETDVIIRRQAAQGTPDANLRYTAWSEPSVAVRIPTGKTLLVGPVAEPSMTYADSEKRIAVPNRPYEEPKVNLLALTWDSAKSYDVVTPVEVGRGALVNGTGDTKTRAIDLEISRVRKLDKYKFATDALVLDIYGGNKIGNITSPGYALIMNEAGDLEIHGEKSDFERYDFNSIPDEEKNIGVDTGTDDKGGATATEPGRASNPRGRQRNSRQRNTAESGR